MGPRRALNRSQRRPRSEPVLPGDSVRLRGGPGDGRGGPAVDRGVGQEMAPTSKSTSKKTSYVYPTEFENVWAIHHRGAKKAAFAEWKKAVPDLISQSDLETALNVYCRTFDVKFKGAHLHQWIKDERWEEALASQSTGNGPGRLARV